ncbi:DNA (cytosine-5-)-methyltransferase [Psittacicella hinzii]|uniref:DNA (cytosine-5-)-methyltransferase n=1 Tax=Psittacicella hinzii TaxID=2028575 RepID=A0A3A1Y3L9_9GAMM|nr:DNA cytosine methyltransferase [Psittacicella hinzii]RIY31846.1 DNA (cytosine-5-)-methyltransferase [Psittacicella hinzii]
MIKDKPTYISLFSSAGVGCYGFKLEGFECIATNELIERRLNIQKLNQKCKFDSGYISGDIQQESTKELIHNEIAHWHKLGNDRVDVVIATPPCQGMSVANHKKSENEIERNSLIRESVNLIKDINPRFFIFENVSAFWKTGCIDNYGNVVAIGEMITRELSSKYLIHHQVINFKNYGSNSSRPRTLVIGVERKLADDISPVELMPNYTAEKTLFEVIGQMPSLNWGEYDPQDFFHSFRTYPEHMLPWIQNLAQGQSAFDNEDDTLKPHRIIDGKIVINQAKNADKYTRQVYNKVAPCIHTRNDQMASQNTLHPVDNRVFSIRELMKLMTIPESFKWLEYDLSTLNSMSLEQKQKVSKKEELNIRQSIGEAVPTTIFQQIAHNIKTQLLYPHLTLKEIKELIEQNHLDNTQALKSFILANKGKYSLATLAKIIEYANAKRQQNSAYFTNKYIVQQIFNHLPNFSKDTLEIIEPSVGSGNFLPFIFKKYADKKQVKLTLVDIDPDTIELLQLLYDQTNIPSNFTVNFVCADYMQFEHDKVDLIIGNPPFSKINGQYRASLLENNFNKESTNLAEFILEKAIKNASYVSLVMPKTILNTPEFSQTRKYLQGYNIESIIDFGEHGFKGVLVETINLVISTSTSNSSKDNEYTQVESTSLGISIKQKSSYIFDQTLPYWIIYRDQFFDQVYAKMQFDIFDPFRDRQITNSNSSLVKTDKHNIRVLKSRNIVSNNYLIDIEDYDSFIDVATLEDLAVKKYLNDTSVYLTPNMTYKPRIIQKGKGYVVNGSVAILIPKDSSIKLSQAQMEYIESDEFRHFYKIARNFQTRSLNIDKTSCYWFGINTQI